MNNYWKIRLKNMDPLRIADDKSSQHGQTDTLRYIPGSALRGYGGCRNWQSRLSLRPGNRHSSMDKFVL